MAANPKTTDIDAVETREWIDSLQSVIDRDGIERAHFLLTSLMDQARESGAGLPFSVNTPYINTIPESRAEHTPGDAAIEWRIRSLIRWNALAMVVQANRLSSELGGHIASFASAATLYDVGFNHFWHAPNEAHGGDLIFMQGHSAQGSTHAPFSRAASAKTASTSSARRSAAKGSRRTRTRGSCPTSGSSPPCRWDSARSWPSIRRGS